MKTSLHTKTWLLAGGLVLALAVVFRFGTGCGAARSDCQDNDPGCNLVLFYLQFLNDPPTESTVASHVYATDAVGNFYTFSVNRFNGSLTQLSSVALGSTQGAEVEITPDQAFVYADGPFGGAPGIYGFSIADPDAPVALSGSPFDAGLNHRYSFITPNGKYFYSSTGGSTISAFNIDSSTGTLSAVTGSPFGSTCATSIVTDSESKFLYNDFNLGANTLEYYTIDQSTGALTLQGGLNPAGVIQNLRPSDQPNRIYGSSNFGSGWRIYTIGTDASGVPSISSSVGVGTTSDSLNAFDTNDAVAVGIENFRTTAQSFTVASDGSMTFNGEVGHGTALTAGGVTVSPAGDFAWVADAGPQIVTYRINADGSLSQLSSVSVGSSINDMKVRTQTVED